MFGQVSRVQTGEEGLGAEIAETLQEADTDFTQASGTAPFRGQQSEVVITLLPKGCSVA